MVRATSLRLALALALALLACKREGPPPAPAASTSSTLPSATVSASASAAPAERPPPDAVPREAIDVPVDGVTERWRLEWRRPPLPTCLDAARSTCACAGFELGEKGDLDLVRERPGAPDERLHLNSLFDDSEARLPRWTPQPGDRTAKIDLRKLAERALVPVMKLGDYDHDGRATEFVLQVAAYDCGHTPAVVVGIDRTRGLHAFASVEKPGEPLTLESVAAWEKVKAGLPLAITAVPCGDHGADQEQRLELRRDERGLHATLSARPCR